MKGFLVSTSKKKKKEQKNPQTAQETTELQLESATLLVFTLGLSWDEVVRAALKFKCLIWKFKKKNPIKAAGHKRKTKAWNVF